MDIVQMILCGKVNKTLFPCLRKQADVPLVWAAWTADSSKAIRLVDPDGTEYGYVGDVKEVNEKVVLDVLNEGFIPVVSSVAAGMDEETNYNINADTAAEKLAVALKAKN